MGSLWSRERDHSGADNGIVPQEIRGSFRTDNGIVLEERMGSFRTDNGIFQNRERDHSEQITGSGLFQHQPRSPNSPKETALELLPQLELSGHSRSSRL